MSGPLEGIRVVDWSVMQHGPVAAAMLGDLGAEVIKVEDRVAGDPARGMMKMHGAMMGIHGRNYYYETNNRNKRGITVDLKKEEGRQIVYRLVEKSDVFLHNFRLGVPERLGMDYKTLSEHNSRLIYVNCTGFGARGPDANKPILDPLAMARSGIMIGVGEPDMPPIYFPFSMADQIGAVMASYAVLAGIIARERLGVGQEINSSLLGGMTCCALGLNLSCLLTLGQKLHRYYRSSSGNPLYNWYRCSDEKWFFLALHQPDRHWHNFCEAMEIQYLEDDSRFADTLIRAKNASELIAILDDLFARKSRDEWMNILGQYKDFIFGPINDLEDLPNDPQMLQNNYIIDYDHPAHGEIKMVGFPFEMTKTPHAVQREAPEFGQHTEEVLTELLGYSWDDVVRLRDEEVV